MNWIRIALFKDRTGAEPCRQWLLCCGVAAELRPEPALARLWFVSEKEAGIRLMVPADRSETARRLLLEWSAAEGFEDDAIHCPECGSLRIDYPQFTEKSVFTNLVMGLATELRLLKRAYYCQACHCMWSKPDAKPKRERVHTAPNYFIEGNE